MTSSSLSHRSSCKKEKKKLPSRHIRSVVLIETRCRVVNVYSCTLLFLSYSHDLKTHTKAVAWKLFFIRSMKYVVLKPCVTVKNDASLDVIQTPQTFSGIVIILSVAIDPPVRHSSTYSTKHSFCFYLVNLFNSEKKNTNTKRIF